MCPPKSDPKNTESSETETELVETHSDSTESSHFFGEIAHATAEGLGIGIKGLHGIGKHIPHPVHRLEQIAEVTSEVLHDNSTNDSIENKVCGTLAGVAKVVVGATASVGLAVLTRVPVVGKVATKVIIEGVTAGVIGDASQNAVNELTKPVGTAVNKVCHAAFDYCKGDSVVKAEISSEAQSVQSELGGGFYRPFMHSLSPLPANQALTNPDFIKIVVDALPTERTKKTHIEFCKHHETGEVCRYALDLKDLEAHKKINDSFLETVDDTIDVKVYFPWEDKTVTLPPQMGINFIRFLKHFKPWSEEYHCYHFATEMVYGENARVVANRTDLQNAKKDFTEGVGVGKVVALYNDKFHLPLLQSRPTGHIAVSIGHDSYLGLSDQGINISSLDELKTSMSLNKSVVVFDADKGINLLSNKGQIDPASIAFNAEKFYREIANTALTDTPIPDVASVVQGETFSALKSQTSSFFTSKPSVASAFAQTVTNTPQVISQVSISSEGILKNPIDSQENISLASAMEAGEKKQKKSVTATASLRKTGKITRVPVGQTPTDSSRPYLGSQGISRLAPASSKSEDTKPKKVNESSGASKMFESQYKASANTPAQTQSMPAVISESTMYQQVHTFFESNKSTYARLQHHVLPVEFRDQLTTKYQEYLSKWVAKAAYQRFQQLQQKAQAPLNEKTFTDNFVRILCGENQTLNNTDYNPFSDLNAVIAEEIKDNPEHAALKELYLKKAATNGDSLASPPQLPEREKDRTAQDRVVAKAYLDEAQQYAQAASIAANLFGHKKAGAAFGDIAGGLACMTPLMTASTVSGGPVALAAVGGLLILHGALSVTGLLSDDEDSGPNPLLQELGIVKSLIYEVIKNTILIFNRMVEEFKHLNAKIDEYHLDHIKRFMLLLQDNSKNQVEMMQYIRANTAEILRELQTLKEYMPRILDTYYEMAMQQLSRHIAVLSEFRSLHIQPDRRLVTEVESKLKTAEAVQEPISLAELRTLNTKLYLAATEETKQGHLTAANVVGSPASTRPEEIQTLMETLVLPTQQANISNAGLATSAYAIELLRKTAEKEGWIRTEKITGEEDEYRNVALGNPLLMQDRVKTLNHLHKHYQKQDIADLIEGAAIRHEMSQTAQNLQDLQDFYHHVDPKKLMAGLSKYLQAAATDFKVAIQKEQTSFLKAEGDKVMLRMKQAVLADSQILGLNVKHSIDFAFDETWGKFFHKFELSNFSNWTQLYPNNVCPHIGWRYYAGALWGVFPSYPDPICKSEDVDRRDDEEITISEASRRVGIASAEKHWLSCNGDGVVGTERMGSLEDAWTAIRMDDIETSGRQYGLMNWNLLDPKSEAVSKGAIPIDLCLHLETIILKDDKYYLYTRGKHKDFSPKFDISDEDAAQLKPFFTDRYKTVQPGEEHNLVERLLHPDLIPEARFVRAALMPEKKSDRSEEQLTELVRDLRQNSKEVYLDKQNENYLAYQAAANKKLSESANAVLDIADFSKWSLFSDNLGSISGKRLPMRLVKPMLSSNLQQNFWIDVESLSTIHPTVKQMELCGAGRIEATYHMQVIKEQGTTRRVRTTLNLQFVCHDAYKTIIPLDSTSIEEDVASLYSLDEVAYHLWCGGKFATGETVDLSSRELTNTKPVLIQSKHAPILERMKPLLTKKTSLEKELQQTISEWRVRYCQYLSENLKTNPAFMAYLQRVEVIAGFFKSYFHLLQAHEIEGLEKVLEPLATKNVIKYLEKYRTAPDAKGIQHYFETAMKALFDFIEQYKQHMPEQFHDGQLQLLLNELSTYLHGIEAFNEKMRQQIPVPAESFEINPAKAGVNESIAVDEEEYLHDEDDAEETDDEEMEVLQAVTRKYFADNDIEEPEQTGSMWIKPDCDNYKPGERILPKACLSLAEDRVTFFNYLKNKKHYLVSKRRIDGETESIVQTQTVKK